MFSLPFEDLSDSPSQRVAFQSFPSREDAVAAPSEDRALIQHAHVSAGEGNPMIEHVFTVQLWS
jgi:hypothetical protein